jgi:two-component system, OmpR family, catabolic regulation response regulator CreB
MGDHGHSAPNQTAPNAFKICVFEPFSRQRLGPKKRQAVSAERVSSPSGLRSETTARRRLAAGSKVEVKSGIPVARVLVVEDEVSIADTLRFALGDDGHEPTWVRLAEEALSCLEREPFDLVILDVGLPDRSGFELCKQIRKFSEIPVIFLSARGSEVDRIVGLEIGGDDYVTKPFSPREVATRVRTVLKRWERPKAKSEEPRAAQLDPPETFPGTLTIDSKTMKASYRGTMLRLTPLEYKLAQLFAENPGQVFSRVQLLEALGLFLDTNYERNVDGHIKTLRAKLREISPDEEPIVTHRGFGYSYEP